MHKRKVLVVDDNTGIRTTVCSALDFERHDYIVYEASDGEEAIEMMEREDIDLVILDLEMPRTNGWECLRVIRDPDDGWPDTKVIMLTVQKEAENALKSWTIGADCFIGKPFAVSALMKAVEKALNLEVVA
jgi:two-component system response regulator (stage 0 sporulation protein F)